jgi:proton glutamate symport protein
MSKLPRHPEPEAGPPRWYHLTLSKQMVLALILGALFGWLFPHVAQQTALLRDIFLHLIQMMIAPLIFASIVQGIAGGGELKQVGRIGLKAIVYFEILTGLALVVGLTVVNVVQPGLGVHLSGDTTRLASIGSARPMDVPETILHIFPTSIVDAMAHGDVLQIVAFSLIFAMAVSVAGEDGKVVLAWCDSLRLVMFKFAGLIMKFAPIGVGAAVAVTVSGPQGLGALVSLGKLLLTLYAALIIFIVVIFGSVILLTRLPLLPFIRAVKNPFTLAFATANSEAALPDAFAKMERFGVPRGIVGFVLPMGYSFNLDGTTLYLGVASVFIAQAAQSTGSPHFGIGQQLTMMFMLMLTSKGVAAVPRASLVVLIAALQTYKLPLAGAAMILGVDAFMDMARTSVNVLGNCLASAVIARWQGEFDEKKALREFGSADS